ncbi:MAG: MerR family transcriptional regulator [Planctomycetia bacterium]
MSREVTEDRTSETTDRPPSAAGGPVASARPGATLPHADQAADEPAGVSRLYSVAMMADLLGVPRSAVRHWLRRGLLEPSRRSGATAWFEFPQLVVGRRLARLMESGFSLRDIDTKLSRLAPDGAAAAARSAERIVADGRRLSIRRDGRLVGADGQMQLECYTSGLGNDRIDDREPAAVCPFVSPTPPTTAATTGDTGCDAAEAGSIADLLDLAADLESQGAFVQAAEALRAVLQAAGPTAQIVFMLAEVLYRTGDLTAARERYYATLELDANHLEARLNLGCVLAELGEHELALAALDGVLHQEPRSAEAHWHLAGVLGDIGQDAASRRHLEAFVGLAPESPWAHAARQRLGTDEPLLT